MLVGAVGIGNNNERISLDFQGTQRNAKSWKSHEWEDQGILVAPSKRPRLSCLFDAVR